MQHRLQVTQSSSEVEKGVNLTGLSLCLNALKQPPLGWASLKLEPGFSFFQNEWLSTRDMGRGAWRVGGTAAKKSTAETILPNFTTEEEKQLSKHSLTQNKLQGQVCRELESPAGTLPGGLSSLCAGNQQFSPAPQCPWLPEVPTAPQTPDLSSKSASSVSYSLRAQHCIFQGNTQLI